MKQIFTEQEIFEAVKQIAAALENKKIPVVINALMHALESCMAFERYTQEERQEVYRLMEKNIVKGNAAFPHLIKQ